MKSLTLHLSVLSNARVFSFLCIVYINCDLCKTKMNLLIITMIVSGAVGSSYGLTALRYFNQSLASNMKVFTSYFIIDMFLDNDFLRATVSHGGNDVNCTALMNSSRRHFSDQLRSGYVTYANCLRPFNYITPTSSREELIANLGAIICAMKRNRDCRSNASGHFYPTGAFEGRETCRSSIGSRDIVNALALTKNQLTCVIESGVRV